MTSKEESNADRFYDSTYEQASTNKKETKFKWYRKGPDPERNKFIDELLNEKQIAFKKYLKMKKEIIIDDLCSLTIHGIPNIARTTGRISTTMWIIITLISAGLSAYYIEQGIMDYLGYGVTTQIRFIIEQPAMFPTVTLCNVNPFTTQYSLGFLKDALTNGGMVLDGLDPLSTENIAYQTLDFSSYLAVSNAMSPYFSDTDKQRLGFNVSEFVLSCSFNKLPCDLTEFSWYYDFYKGNCFSFNVGISSTGETIPFKTTIRAGKEHALTLDLFVGLSSDTQKLSWNRGVNVKVHNHTTFPSTSSIDGYDAAPGFETSFVINRLVRDQLPDPYSECLLDNRDPIQYDSILYNAIVASNYSYTQIRCFDQCYELMVIEACGCYDLVFGSVLAAPPCVTQSQIDCTNIIWLEYTTTDVKTRCTKYCPLECNSITFTMSTSQLEYPSESYANILLADPVYMAKFRSAMEAEDNSTIGTTITSSILKNNIARVVVYYENNMYQYISEFPSMNGVSLLGNLGGTIGVFLGMSILSVLEITEVLILMCSYFYASTLKKYFKKIKY